MDEYKYTAETIDSRAVPLDIISSGKDNKEYGACLVLKIFRYHLGAEAVTTIHSNGRYILFVCLGNCRYLFNRRASSHVCLSIPCLSTVSPFHDLPDATNQQRSLGTQPPPPPPALTPISTAALGRYPTVPAIHPQRPRRPRRPQNKSAKSQRPKRPRGLSGFVILTLAAMLCSDVGSPPSKVRFEPYDTYQPLGVGV